MLGKGGGALALATQNGVQFSTEQEEEAGQIHPGQEHDDRCEGEIGRVVAVITRDVKLEELGHRHPADREEDSARQGLANGEVIFRRQEIKRERENDEREGGEREAERGHPALQGYAELKIYLRASGEGLAKNGDVEGEQDSDAKPEQKQQRNNVFAPPAASFGYSVGAAEGVRDGGNEHRAQINAEEDSGSDKRAATPGDDDIRHHAVENFLHPGVGWEKRANDAEHLV